MHNVLDMHVHPMHIAEMDLATWMHNEKISDAELAIRVNRDRTTVTRWRSGKTRPDWEAIEALQTVTKGRVTAKDFVKLESAK